MVRQNVIGTIYLLHFSRPFNFSKEVSTVASKNWRARAACRDVDPELFFPLAEVFPPKQEAAAKTVCRRCPVRAECLSWACRTGLTDGIAGGMTEPERRALRRLAS